MVQPNKLFVSVTKSISLMHPSDIYQNLVPLHRVRIEPSWEKVEDSPVIQRPIQVIASVQISAMTKTQ